MKPARKAVDVIRVDLAGWMLFAVGRERIILSPLTDKPKAFITCRRGRALRYWVKSRIMAAAFLRAERE